MAPRHAIALAAFIAVAVAPGTAQAGDTRGEATHTWRYAGTGGAEVRLSLARTPTGAIREVFVSAAAWPCASGGYPLLTAFAARAVNVAVSDDGRFSHTGPAFHSTEGNDFGTVRISGRFATSRRAEGTLQIDGDAGPAMGVIVPAW